MNPLSDEMEALELRNALFRQKLRQALGLSGPPDLHGNSKRYEMMLKKKRLTSILKEQLKQAGMEELASRTRFKKG